MPPAARGLLVLSAAVAALRGGRLQGRRRQPRRRAVRCGARRRGCPDGADATGAPRALERGGRLLAARDALGAGHVRHDPAARLRQRLFSGATPVRATSSRAVRLPRDSGEAHTLAAATRQRAAKRRSGAPAEFMMSGARMAPSRPQPDPQPIPELRHSVGKISAATMYATLTAATDAKRPASTAVMASGAPAHAREG